MSCCSEAKPGKSAGGSCCGGSRPFPWFSAITDPALGRLFLLRYWRELLLGTSAGLLAGGAGLALGDLLGALGPLLRGPWLRLHPGAVLPAALLGGLILALGYSARGLRGALGRSGWVLGCAALAGLLNGLLDQGEPSLGAFFQDGLWTAPLGFALLALPAIALLCAAFSLGFRSLGLARGCQ